MCLCMLIVLAYSLSCGLFSEGVGNCSRGLRRLRLEYPLNEVRCHFRVSKSKRVSKFQRQALCRERLRHKDPTAFGRHDKEREDSDAYAGE